MRVEPNAVAAAGSAPNVANQASGHSQSFLSELVSHLAEAAGVNPALALRVAARESGFNPSAVNPESGAVGIMQLMPGTAAGLGVNPHNVVENIKGGVQYLRQQLDHFGNLPQALAAYNWGPANVAQAVARWGADWLDHAPAETRQYIAGILGGHRGGSPAREPAPDTGANLVASAAPPANSAARAEIEQAMDAYLMTAILE